MNVSPQYSLTGGGYTNLPTGDPKIWSFLLDATSLTPGDYTSPLQVHASAVVILMIPVLEL